MTMVQLIQTIPHSPPRDNDDRNLASNFIHKKSSKWIYKTAVLKCFKRQYTALIITGFSVFDKVIGKKNMRFCDLCTLIKTRKYVVNNIRRWNTNIVPKKTNINLVKRNN